MSTITHAPVDAPQAPVGSVRHTLTVLWWGWKATLSGAAEYRADLITGTLVSLLWLGVSAVPSIVVSLHTDGAGGWTLPRLMFLLSIWYLMDAVMWIIIVPNIGQWGSQVQTGALDAVLLRPVSSLIMCSLRSLGVQDLPKILLAAALGIGAIVTGGGPVSPLAFVASVVATLCAITLMWAFGVLTSYKVLTKVQFDGSFLLHAGHNLARVPVPMYGRTMQVLLTWVVPVAFLATVPAQLLFGMTSMWMLLGAVLITVAVVALVVALWNREVKRYSGAMS